MPETPEPDAIGTTPSVEFVNEDLVVALEHRRLVEAELARLQLRYKDSDEDKDLDLVLLKGLSGLASRAMQVRAYHGPEIAHLETAAQRPFTDLDAVLFAMRGQFAERYGGWVPDMGKNRQIARVVPAGPGETLRMSAGPSPGSALPATALPFAGFGILGPGRTIPMLGILGPGRTMPMTDRDPRPVNPEIFREASGNSGMGVRVGVVDTALHELIPDPGGDDEPVRPFAGHATFVTSLIKQQAPAATLTLEPLFDRKTGKATAWDTAKAMVGFSGAGNTVDILNVSLGCLTADGQPPLVLARAMERLAGKVLVVAAAGNHAGSHPSAPMWPAALRNVVAVGAYRGKDGALADFSPTLPWVTVTAPGVDVVGAFPTALIELSDGTRVMFDGAAKWSGTSFAAATVSGVVAAAMTDGKSAQDAFDELLRRPGGVVRQFEYTP